jgi:WD40 repeat protein
MPPEERRLRRQAGETDPVRLLAIHPNGSFVCSAGEHRIKVFRWETREFVMELPCEGAELDHLVVTPEGWLLAMGGDIRGWNLDTGAERPLSGWLGTVRRCVFLPDGAGRLLTSSGNTCTIRDLSTFKPLRKLTHDAASVRTATLSTRGDRVMSIDDDDVVHVWDARTGARISTWPRAKYGDPTCPPRAVQIDPEGRWILSTTLVDTYLWDVDRGAHRWHVEGPSPNLSLFFLSDGERIAVMTGHNGGVETWDMVAGQRLRSFPAMRARAPVAALGPDGRTLIVCNDDGFGFQIVDVEKGVRVTSMRRHTSPIEKLLVHPDGRALLAAGREEPIVIWDMSTGSPTGRLGGSPARGALEGDDVPPIEPLLDAFMVQLERKFTGYRSAARAGGDDDGEEYRDEARWIESYWGEVQALEMPPDTRRDEVLNRLEALVGEVGGNGVWMAPRDIRALIAELRRANAGS